MMIAFLLWAATHSDEFRSVLIIPPFSLSCYGDNPRFLCISLDWEIIYPWWMNGHHESFQRAQERQDAPPVICYGGYVPEDDIPF